MNRTKIDLGREALLRELAAYRAGDVREREMTERLRAFVSTCADCFERSNAAGHVTGSAWVVARDGSSVLLTQHRKLNKWLQLGGHADGEPDIRRVALREAAEESGLAAISLAQESIYDIDVHAIPERGVERAHLHYDIRFACFADPATAPVASAESHAVAWIAFADLERYAIDESVRRLAAKTASLFLRAEARKS